MENEMNTEVTWETREDFLNSLPCQIRTSGLLSHGIQEKKVETTISGSCFRDIT